MLLTRRALLGGVTAMAVGSALAGVSRADASNVITSGQVARALTACLVVNLHTSHVGTVNSNPAVVTALIDELGVRRVRDRLVAGVPSQLEVLRHLATRGIRLHAVVDVSGDSEARRWGRLCVASLFPGLVTSMGPDQGCGLAGEARTGSGAAGLARAVAQIPALAAVAADSVEPVPDLNLGGVRGVADLAEGDFAGWLLRALLDGCLAGKARMVDLFDAPPSRTPLVRGLLRLPATREAPVPRTRSFVALRNLLHIIGHNAVRGESGGLVPIAGQRRLVRHWVTSRPDGGRDLLLWQAAAQRAVPCTAQVRLAAPSSVVVFDPLVSEAPISSARVRELDLFIGSGVRVVRVARTG